MRVLTSTDGHGLIVGMNLIVIQITITFDKNVKMILTNVCKLVKHTVSCYGIRKKQSKMQLKRKLY